MTQPGIEPRSPGPLANTLPISPMAQSKVYKRANKGHLRVISQHSSSWMKHEGVNNPSLTSGALFRSPEEATVSRNTRYCLLKKVGTSVRPVTKSWLTKEHIQMHLKWAKENMKVDFSKVLFTDKSRATWWPWWLEQRLEHKWTRSSVFETPTRRRRRRYCDLGWYYLKYHCWSVKSVWLDENNYRCLYNLLQRMPGILALKIKESLSREISYFCKIMLFHIQRIKLRITRRN